MALRNEILIGENPKYNNLKMYRKVDDKPFLPEFQFISDDELSLGSNIEVRYIEYYKDSNGDIITELVKHKTYIVPNIPATYKQVVVIDTPEVLYQEGEIITPEVLGEDGETVITPAGIATGTEVKTQAITHVEEQIDKPAWNAANDWFMSLARTPMQVPYGVMDAIESTLQQFPFDIPNGYHLQGPLS